MLRTLYTPRYVRTMRIHYRANFPCTPQIASTNLDEILYGWSLSETNDGAGGKWLSLVSPNTTNLLTSIPYGALGNLVSFNFHDLPASTNAFSLFAVDNTVYNNTNMPPVGQSFTTATNGFIYVYPALPHGTPVPWLAANGWTGASNILAAAELSDFDHDGVPTWMEYLAGTNPKNISSAFKVRSFGRPNIYVPYQVVFSSVVGKTYRVDASSDLINWTAVQDGITGTGSDITVPDTSMDPQTIARYYRIWVY